MITDPITFNNQTEKYGDEWGPCFIGTFRDRVREYNPKELHDLNMLNLGYFNLNPWKALRLLADHKIFDDAAVKKLCESSRYKCPITDNTYYALLPLAIFSDDLDKYFNEGFKPWYYEMAVDKSWNCQNDNSHLTYNAWRIYSAVHHCILGPGYTECTLPSDGSADHEIVMLDLSNGDKTVAVARTWYNK